jgi:hypothetical protein
MILLYCTEIEIIEVHVIIVFIMPTSVCAVTCSSVGSQFNARHVDVRLHSFCFYPSHILTLLAYEMTRVVPSTGDYNQASCGLVISVATPIQMPKISHLFPIRFLVSFKTFLFISVCDKFTTPKSGIVV